MTTTEYVIKRFFSAKTRRHLAGTGAAMAGGRYPIKTKSDVVHAEELMHNSSDQSAVRAHIRSRAKALGVSTSFGKDWGAWDQERGAGEKTGRLAGTLAGAAGAVKVAGKVARVLKPRKLPLRVAAAGLAAYGTYQGAKAVGGYVGRKIDEATARVFKDGGPSKEADWARKWIDRRHAKAARLKAAFGAKGDVVKGTVEQTMREYKHGTLHSGSKHGPKVKSRAQAVAIAMSQAGLSKSVDHAMRRVRKLFSGISGSIENLLDPEAKAKTGLRLRQGMVQGRGPSNAGPSRSGAGPDRVS